MSTIRSKPKVAPLKYECCYCEKNVSWLWYPAAGCCIDCQYAYKRENGIYCCKKCNTEYSREERDNSLYEFDIPWDDEKDDEWYDSCLKCIVNILRKSKKKTAILAHIK
jgi:hypothetical protein